MRPAPLSFVAACVLLAGCTNQMVALEAGTLMTTDKTVADHVISWASGKDCSTVRWELGRTYCKEDEPRPVANVYCYRTLGDVTCYDRPDPYGNREQKMGVFEHNLPR